MEFDTLILHLSVAMREAAIAPFSVDNATEQADAWAQHFQVYGCCVFKGIFPSEMCAELVNVVDNELLTAIDLTKERDLDDKLLAAIRCQEYRWDVKLLLSPLIEAVVRRLCHCLGGMLQKLVTADGLLAEVSCIITDPGAQRQELHRDTTDDNTALITAFISLQPISKAMGPTILCPVTHGTIGQKLASLPFSERVSDASIAAWGGHSQI